MNSTLDVRDRQASIASCEAVLGSPATPRARRRPSSAPEGARFGLLAERPPSIDRDLHVLVVSPAEAEQRVAEFWAGSALFGFTRVEDGELVLSIEPRRDGSAVLVDAHSLAAALARAMQLLESS